MKNIFLSASILLGTLLISSCSKDDLVTNPRPDLQIPTVYDGSSFEKNAATELGLLDKLTALSNEMKKARVNGVVVDYAILSGLLNEGNPSLKSIGSSYSMSKIDGVGNLLDQTAKASGGTYVPGEASENGGIFGGYLFDENGIDLEEFIVKGMNGSVLYKHATDLLEGTIDVTTSDKVIAIFGAHPSFANSSDKTKHDYPDKFIAGYTARRDKNDETNPGFYLQIKTALIKLQAAAKAGSEYKKEQQQAANAIKINWEKGSASTVINYLYSVVSKLSSNTPADQAVALHSLGECIGFIQGLKTISGKKITDAQIDQILVLFNAPDNGSAPTVYKFATDGVNELPKIQEAIVKIQNVYGFTSTDLEDFKQNWVSIQKR